jgi:hypothetical protein
MLVSLASRFTIIVAVPASVTGYYEPVSAKNLKFSLLPADYRILKN